ncbi:MAG: hypothetical protein JEY71_10325 [Sphaerochaeta sp.]|nr:hypothetical protein [Sphaerochaeta sp.]
MKKLTQFLALAMLLLSLLLAGGCASYSKGSSGSRDNPTKLKPSPCAGCFSLDEKEALGIADHDA